MGFQVSELLRLIADKSQMPRMMSRHHEGQARILELQHGPSGVLILHCALEVQGVPGNGGGDVGDHYRDVVESIKGSHSSILRLMRLKDCDETLPGGDRVLEVHAGILGDSHHGLVIVGRIVVEQEQAFRPGIAG